MIYKLKENKKEILDFIKRIILLSVLFIHIFPAFTFFGMIFNTMPVEIFYTYYGSENDKFTLYDNYIHIFSYMDEFLAYYFILKIFGFFKKTDKINFFFALLIIIFVGLISGLCSGYLYSGYINAEIFRIYVLNIISAFLLHRFFNFLTKKFPNPFEKIGYYSSFAFWKDLFKKAMQNKKEVFFNFLRIILLILFYAFLTPFICKRFSLEFENTSFLILFGFFLYSYFGLKLFGFFKKTDNLKLYQAYLILLVLSVIVRRWLSYTLYSADLCHIALIWCFLLSFVSHRFFNFLTKKYPNPFEKIKYYSSIEFWKDLLKRR